MEYLVIQASFSAQHKKAPSFVLLPLKNRMLSVFDDLQEMAEEAKETDSSIVGIERWLPVAPCWIGYEEPVFEAVQETRETDGWSWPTLWLADREIENMDVKSIDAQRIQMQTSTQAMLVGRQGDIRVRSQPIVKSDLEA